MILNINSPAYYTNQYGVIDEIYMMCREISYYVNRKEYSSLVNIVGITPIIASKDVIDKGLFKEEKKCETQYGFASVSLQINYEDFLRSDIDEKKRLIVINILRSVKSIHRKAKLDFDEFEKDIKAYCQQANIVL